MNRTIFAFVGLFFMIAPFEVAHANEKPCQNAYDYGKRVYSATKGNKESLAFLEEKVAAGDFCIAFWLGEVYLRTDKKEEGESLQRKALIETEAAAKSGNHDAQYFMGMYAGSLSENINIDAFKKWMTLAADGGHSKAQKELGSFYVYTSQKDRNIEKGIGLLEKSAAQENTDAMVSLGEYYDFKDYVEAAKWYRMAAERNHESATYNLSDMYAKGDGVSQNWKSAYFWGCRARDCLKNPLLRVAAKSETTVFREICGGPVRDGDLYDVEDHLSKEEIALIQKQASEWKPGMPAPYDHSGFFSQIMCWLRAC
jgi:TPR repeat protein